MEKKKGNKLKIGRYILVGLTIAGLGTAYYFLTRKPASGSNTDLLDLAQTDLPEDEPRASSGSSSSGFPLKKGSRGELVGDIQEMLIRKYGASILPKYGADKVWGSELETALISKGLPTVIDADKYTQLLTSTGTALTTTSTSTTTTNKTVEATDGSFYDPAFLAANLITSLTKNDLNLAMTTLSKIRNPKGYSKVNDAFRTSHGAQPIHSALVEKFLKASDKEKLYAQFQRMGLKYDGKQWTLQGFGTILCDQVKSLEPSRVWNVKGEAINVPRQTILGEFVTARNGVTCFRTLDGKILYTNTKTIGYV